MQRYNILKYFSIKTTLKMTYFMIKYQNIKYSVIQIFITIKLIYTCQIVQGFLFYENIHQN